MDKPDQNKKKKHTNRNWKVREAMEQMDPALFKKWDTEQKYLKGMVLQEDQLSFGKDLSDLKYVGGLDISFSKKNKEIAVSCFVILSFPDLKVIYKDSEFVKLDGPYIPGFLAFREAAHFLKLIRKQQKEKPEITPQVILTDGNGLLHTNACGIACHLGVLMNIPTIGVGKTVFAVDGISRVAVQELCHAKNKKQGDAQLLIGKSGKVWGAGLKPTEKVKDPLIVSVGHKITLETSLIIVRRLCNYRVPEPVRQADIISKQLIKKFLDPSEAVSNTLEFLSLSKGKKVPVIQYEEEKEEVIPVVKQQKTEVMKKNIKKEEEKDGRFDFDDDTSSSEFGANEDPWKNEIQPK